MWRLGTWFSGVLGSVRLTVGFDDLEGLSNLNNLWFYDSITYFKYVTNFCTVQCSNLFYKLFYTFKPASLFLLFWFFSSMFAFPSFCLIPVVNQLCFITMLFQVCSVFLVILWYILWWDYYDNVMVLTLYLCLSICSLFGHFLPFCISCLYGFQILLHNPIIWQS